MKRKSGAHRKSQMTFMGHLLELRSRLLLCLGAIVVCAGVSLVFYGPLFRLVRQPLDDYNTRVQDEHERTSPESGDQAPIIRLMPQGPLSGFLAVLKIGLWGGIILALPILMAQVWAFVNPGLMVHERRAIAPIFLFGLLFFVAGALVAYRWVVPIALDFFYVFNQTLQVEPTSFIQPYVSFVVNLMLAFGIAFEMPLVILALSHVGLVTPRWLWKNARYAMLGAFIVGALITPPDWISQVLLGCCLMVLYGVSILFSYLVVRRRAAAAKETAKGPD